ncbi:hypothetical protein [Streptomyces carpaticus]|uniref:Tox-REase-7 domain-containing protein n=2 Tax=Streptomyces carpaticus TaxID=285558 RepID=A0ABV4ZX52_9ACTN
MSEEMCVPETGNVDRIDPAGIPEFTGNLSMLAADCMGFDAAATRVRSIGSDVHDEFQGLSSFYTAPEAEQLFATTAPARDRAAEFADDLATVRSALWDYHQEITPLVGRLRRLKHEAEEFVASIRDDDDWKQDTAKTDRNNQLRDDVAATVAAFWAAERSCANRINALWGGPQWTTDDGSGGSRMYGVGEADLAAMEEAPWGRAVEREYPAWRIDQHIKSFVWDGLIVDGIWGGLVGLSSLVGLQGWDAMKASWNGLGQLVVGLSLTVNPLGHHAVGLMPDGAVKNWLTDARNLTVETGKGLIAWDMWDEDPARAAGLTTFNVLTTLATFGAGAGVRAAAGSASTATRITATAARIGTAIDIPGHIVTGLTQLNRLSQITDDLARLTATKGFDLPDGTTQLPNGTIVHPGRPYEIDPPHQAVRQTDGSLLLPDGRTLHPDGRLTTPTGDTLQTPDQIPAELSARDRTILDNTTHDPALIGVDRELAGVHSSSRETGTTSPPDSRPGPEGSHGTTPHREGSIPPAQVEGTGPGGTGSSGHTTSHSAPGPGGTGDGGASTVSRGEGPGGQDGGPGEPRSGDAQEPDGGKPGPEEDDAHSASPARQEGGDGSGEPDFTRPALPPGEAQLSLHELRALRSGRHRYTMAEEIGREMYGGGPERHFRVPTHDHPYYPVEAPRGRKVDVPVDLPDGRTLAVEIKHYLEYRTIKLSDGTNKTVKGEVPLSKGIMEQINKDLTLRRMDSAYDPRWVFMDAPPSQELRGYLTQARIIFVEYGPAPKN